VATSPAVELARVKLLAELRWHSGHADVWRLFVNAKVLSSLVDGLAEPWRDTGITHVLGIESRGFLLGGAVAVSLGAGFQAVRKEAGMLPGSKVAVQSAPDYRSSAHLLRMQAVLHPGDVVLLVDDWAERGSQAVAARELVEMCGAHFAGVSILVDQLEDEVRAKLARVTSLVRADELGDPDA
jgi:adenine phosphoribosyltransferase